MRVAGVGQPEDQQRPVPQVQRVRHRAQRHQRPGRQQPIGRRHSAAQAPQVGARQDQQHGGADGHQRPRAGELLGPVDQGPAEQDRRQRDAGEDGAQPHRPADVAHQRADERAQQQFPGSSEAVVVRAGLVVLVGDDRVDERRHRQRAEQDHEDGAPVPGPKAPKNVNAPGDQQQERDVELALHRHRPDVLQRTDGFPRPEVVGRRAGQLPVLVVAQAGQALVGEGLPAGLRLNQDGQQRAPGQDHHQRRNQPPDQPDHFGNRRQRLRGVQRGAQQFAAEEEPGQRQEDVHAAGDPAEPDVEDGDQRDRDATQPVEIVTIKTRRAARFRHRLGGGGLRTRRRQADHIDSQSTEAATRPPSVSARNGAGGGWSKAAKVTGRC